MVMFRTNNFIETVTPTTVIESHRLIMNASRSNILLRFVSEREKYFKSIFDIKEHMKNIYFQLLI